MSRLNTRFFALSILAIATLGVSACSNTIDGAGRDIEHAGNKVQDAAN